jgi:UDP:flavonoid glycosyltransferase YjiC (YdhE family)
VNIVAVCRGAPGLGRVAPALALTATLAATHEVTATYATYAAGARFLAGLGRAFTDLGNPDGLFIDSVAPQAVRVAELAQDADLVLIDGEFFLPVTLAHLDVPVVYLANPHDLEGTPNVFRRVNRLLLGYCDGVIVSSLACAEPRQRPDLVPGTACLEVPALCQDIPQAYDSPSGPPRVLVTTGGGSLSSPHLRAATSNALDEVLGALAQLAADGMISTVLVVPGADVTVPDRWAGAGTWLQIADSLVPLTALYSSHDLLITRAGRNTLAEAAYCGIPTVVLPVSADPHRASEQHDNAAVMAGRPGMFTLRSWHDRDMLLDTVQQALEAAACGVRRTGQRGNAAAAAFARALVPGVLPAIRGAAL